MEYYIQSYLSNCQDLCNLYNLADYINITSEATYDDNFADIAKAYIHISPSHVSKLYTLLSKISLSPESYNKGKELICVLTHHFLSIIDLGSGYGTIPQAIICNNQYINDNLVKQKLPIFPYYLDFVRVDSSEKSLEIGFNVMRCGNNQIKIKDFVFADDLRDKPFGQYINCIDTSKPYIFIASNLFKWLKDEEGYNVIQKINGCLLNDMHPAKSYLRINAHLEEDKNSIIEFIENNFNHLGKLLSKLARKTKLDKFTPPQNDQYIHIQCNDPRKENNLINVGFDYNFKIEYNKSIINNLKDIPLNDLKILYEKAYWHQRFHYPSSESFWRIIRGPIGYINYLHESLNFAYQCWHCSKLIDKGKSYKYPKKNGTSYRELIFLSPIDSIVEMQIINSIGPQLENIMDKNFNIPVSLGNRILLDNSKKQLKKSKTIFKYWPEQFKKRTFTTLQQVSQNMNGYTVSLDISNYYPSIPHNELIQVVRKYTDPKKHFQINWIKDYIALAKPDNLTEIGIPQGPPLSHLLANLYLFDKVDTRLKANGFDPNRYTRYVDDINYVATDLKKAEEFKEWIIKSISPLKINPEKTKIIPNNEYYNILSPNKNIDEINEKFSKLIFEIYITACALSQNNIFRDDDDYKIYHQCLKELGINIPWEWIKLKAKSPGFNSYLNKLYKTDRNSVHNKIALNLYKLIGYAKYLKALINSTLIGNAAKTVRKQKYIFLQSLFKPQFIMNLNEIKTQIINEIVNSLKKYSESLKSENESNIEIEKTERALRFLFNRFKYFCTDLNKVEIKILLDNFQNINDLSSIEETLKELRWAINNVKSVEESNLGDYKEKELAHFLNYLKKNNIKIDKISLLSDISMDWLKLLLIDCLDKKQISICNDVTNQKIIIENNLFLLDFPYFDSLNLSLNHYQHDLKMWLEEPYESVIDIGEDFPLILEEMGKYYYSDLKSALITR